MDNYNNLMLLNIENYPKNHVSISILAAKKYKLNIILDFGCLSQSLVVDFSSLPISLYFGSHHLSSVH